MVRAHHPYTFVDLRDVVLGIEPVVFVVHQAALQNSVYFEPDRRVWLYVSSSMATNTDVSLFSVASETLQSTKARAVFAYQYGRFIGQNFLIRARLHELANPKTTGIAGGFFAGNVWLVPMTLSP